MWQICCHIVIRALIMNILRIGKWPLLQLRPWCYWLRIGLNKTACDPCRQIIDLRHHPGGAIFHQRMPYVVQRGRENFAKLRLHFRTRALVRNNSEAHGPQGNRHAGDPADDC